MALPAVTRLLTLEPLERRPGWAITGVAILFASIYVIALTVFPREHGRILDGDAIQYYAYLRSAAFDGDFDFTNDYRFLYQNAGGPTENVWLERRTPVGRAENLMSIGPAILWAPVFALVTSIVTIGRLLGSQIPLDGFAVPFQLSAGVAGIGYAAAGTYLCFRTCRLLFPTAPSFWAAMTAWLASPAVYYSVVSPAYSHATSLFAVSLFCFHWLRTKDRYQFSRYVQLGVLGGLVTLVRWQDGIILLLPVIELAVATRRGALSWRLGLGRVALVGGFALMTFTPQLVAWYANYGQVLLMPQGQSFMRWWDPAIPSVLFSWRHGLLTWTPAVLVALIGLGLLVRRNRLLGWSAVAVVSLAIYVNGAVLDWWAGEAFGARRFIGTTPFLALGFACVFSIPAWENRRSLMRWTATAMVLYNLLFLLQYQLFMRGYSDWAPYPTTARQVLLDRFLVPWQLTRHWLRP